MLIAIPGPAFALDLAERAIHLSQPKGNCPMNLRDILRSKGSAVFTIGPNQTIAEAVRLMVEQRCGSLVVLDGQEMIGILTERDILRTVAQGLLSLTSISVSQRMTQRVITGTPDDDLAHIMGVMTQQRIRHLPVVDGGKLEGLVSIGDIVKAQHEQLTQENHFLMSYIHQS